MIKRIILLTLFVCSIANAGIFEGLNNNQANSSNFSELRAVHSMAMINVWKRKNEVDGMLVENSNKLTANKKSELENQSLLFDCTLLYIEEKHTYFNDVIKTYGHYSDRDLKPLIDTKDIIDRLNEKQFICADHEEEVWKIYIRVSPLK